MVREGYRETELGEIPEEWNVVSLGACLKESPRYGISSPAIPYQYYLPVYIRITDITEDGRFSKANLSSVVCGNLEWYSLSVGDLVIARTGASVGKSYLYNPNDGRLVFAGFLIRFRLNTDILIPAYLSAYLTTDGYWKWVRVNSMRSGQSGINGTEYIRLPIPLPSIEEQRAIATFHSDLDEAIVCTNALIAKLEKVKVGLMQNLLTKGIDEQGRIRREETHAFKNTTIGRIPAEWEILKIGDVLYEIVEPISMRDDEIYRLISIRRRNGGIFERERLPGSKVLTKDLHRVIPGTFLIANRQIVHGACALVKEEFADAAVSSAYTALQARENFDIRFFSWLAETPLMYKYFLDASQGVVLEKMNFHLKEWLDLPIFVPPISEQNRIAAVLTSAEDNIEREETHRDKLLAMKEGLMADLLTGRVRVPAGVACGVAVFDASAITS